MCVCVCVCVCCVSLSFVMTNGSYLFLLKLYLNTNEVIYLGKRKEKKKQASDSELLLHDTSISLSDSRFHQKLPGQCNDSESKQGDGCCLIEYPVEAASVCTACQNAKEIRHSGTYRVKQT